MASTTYTLTGLGGIQVFRNLPEGTKVTLTDGAVGTITANPNDGGFVQVKFTEHSDKSMIGAEEFVFFNQLVSAVSE
jgi:hypothetical protein